MAEIRRPPVLGIGHHLVKIGNHSVEIEGVEFRGIVEIATVGIGTWRMLVERREAQCFRPPVAIARAFAGRTSAMTEWAYTARLFASLFVHVLLLTVVDDAIRRRLKQPSTELMNEQKARTAFSGLQERG